MKFKKCLIVESDLGGPKVGASYGGRALFSELKTYPEVIGKVYSPLLPIRQSETPLAHYLYEINNCLQQISDSVESFFISSPEDKLAIVAGDHSTACGSLAGLKKAFPRKKIGVVWIDAHADIHSPYTTPSGNVHGMPVAAAIGSDHLDFAINELDKKTAELWNSTKRICSNSICCEDLVYVGIRDLEDAEWGILEKNRIKHFSVGDVENSNIEDISSEITHYLRECDLLYISFDIDSLDSKLVPGTGTPVENGLSLSTVKNLLDILCLNPKTKMLEIVEINPLLDCCNETAERIANVLKSVL